MTCTRGLLTGLKVALLVCSGVKDGVFTTDENELNRSFWCYCTVFFHLGGHILVMLITGVLNSKTSIRKYTHYLCSFELLPFYTD